MLIATPTREGPDQHSQGRNDGEYTSFSDHFEASSSFEAFGKKLTDPSVTGPIWE